MAVAVAVVAVVAVVAEAAEEEAEEEEEAAEEAEAVVVAVEAEGARPGTSNLSHGLVADREHQRDHRGCHRSESTALLQESAPFGTQLVVVLVIHG